MNDNQHDDPRGSFDAALARALRWAIAAFAAVLAACAVAACLGEYATH